jgi:signal transduction histidine kinase
MIRENMALPEPPDDRDVLIEELRAAVAARDNFIAVASHELRNPMTPIVGQVELLLGRARRDGSSAATIAGLERLGVAVSHYVRRATTLLEISRMNAGRLVLEPTDFDMAALVAHTTANYEMLAARAGSVLRCDVQGPVTGRWDQLATEQIIDNLISNAVRYGDGKPINVALIADGAGVTLSVADAGAGIPPDDQARIFARFEQAIGTRRKSGGFGIGLWLVRELTEAMGGTIHVECAESGGSTFTVWLPREMRGVSGMERTA